MASQFRTIRRYARPATWLIAVALLAAMGCSGNSKAAPSASGSKAGLSRGAPQNPCALITKTEAESVLGVKLANPQERPLGPTCVYQTPDLSKSVTVSVQQINFSQIKARIQNLSVVDGMGYPAFCGTYGRPQLYVILSDTSELNVVAPCDVAKLFASKALARIHRQ